MKRHLATVLTALFLCLSVSVARAARMRMTVPKKAPVGQPFFLELRFSEPVGDVTIAWRGREYVFQPRGGTVRTILGVPNDTKLVGETFPLTVEVHDGAKLRFRAESSVAATAHDYPKQVLTVAPRMVYPAKSELSRIDSERKLVSAALATVTKGGVLPKSFVRPVGGIPTGYFGGFRVYNGVPRSGHSGLDLRAAAGTRVKAIHDGTVALTGHHYFSGNAVYLDHGGGVLSSYCHLSRILVKNGQKVRAGDPIGLSGATGRVTGPHLHLGVYAGGTWLDALPLLGEASLPAGAETLYEFK